MTFEIKASDAAEAHAIAKDACVGPVIVFESEDLGSDGRWRIEVVATDLQPSITRLPSTSVLSVSIIKSNEQRFWAHVPPQAVEAYNGQCESVAAISQSIGTNAD